MTYSAIHKRLTLLAVILLLATGINSAWAMTLEQAKAAGLIGEQSDGYIGLVQQNAPPEVVELVRDVNRQRRQRYMEIARANEIDVRDVAQLAYARAVEATRSGHYVQDATGSWVRKP